MILKNKDTRLKAQETRNKEQASSFLQTLRLLVPCALCLFIFSYASCHYSFKDVSIPLEAKTFRVNYLENKARYINPQLSPQLTEAVKLKIISNTRLHQTNDDSAHFDISGYVSEYSISTTGVSGNTASTNRLTVTFHYVVKNNLDQSKSSEGDVTYTKDFTASLSLDDVGNTYTADMVSYLTDQIFNKIFSNW